MRNVNLGAGLWLDLLICIETVMNAADNNLRDKFLQDNLENSMLANELV